MRKNDRKKRGGGGGEKDGAWYVCVRRKHRHERTVRAHSERERERDCYREKERGRKELATKSDMV